MINIKVKTCPNCICKNKKNPLKPSKYFGWCVYVSSNSPTVGLTKFTDEKYIIDILNHEIMHIILYKLEGYKTYSKFDRLDNSVKPWYE